MTDNLNAEVPLVGRVRTHGQGRFGKGPMLAVGIVGALLLPALVMGGIGAANAMTSIGAAKSAQQTEALPTPSTGDEAPVAVDPVSPPDRNSDQNGVPPQEDKIYYIQEGDTLTALSAQFGMSIDSIANYNTVRDVNVISTGAVLRVPFIYVPPVG